MKKAVQIIFVAVTLGLLFLPALGLFSPETSPDLGNPDAFVQDNISLKPQWITLHAKLFTALFGETGNEQVIAGKNGFLFFGDTLPDYYARDDQTDTMAEKIADRLGEIQQSLAEKGIRFVFLCAPNKNTLYPEYMPSYAVAADGQTVLRRLEALLAQRGVASVNALAVLENTKKAEGVPLLYHRTDTHWNVRGAYAAYLALMAKLNEADTLVYREYTAELSWDAEEAGDLVRLYLPPANVPAANPLKLIPRTYKAKGVIRSASDAFIQTTAEVNDLHMLVFRDSFGDALLPFLANNIGQLSVSRTFPPELQMIAEESPDVVVLEITERNLAKLLEMEP